MGDVASRSHLVNNGKRQRHKLPSQLRRGRLCGERGKGGIYDWYSNRTWVLQGKCLPQAKYKKHKELFQHLRTFSGIHSFRPYDKLTKVFDFVASLFTPCPHTLLSYCV